MTNGEFEKTMQDSNAESVDSKVQEGIIRGISFSEFHHIAGPKITCQVPDNFISKDIFDNVSVYIIPKAQLQRSTITMTLRDYKILGFSIKIDDKKYARNAFYFNHCFVCNTEAQTVPYEPVVKKMSDFLVDISLPIECYSLDIMSGPERSLFRRCLSRLKIAFSQLPTTRRDSQMLVQVMEYLNLHKMCTHW